jgi:hypothetical protein
MKTTTDMTTTRRNGHRGWHAARPLVPAAIRGEVSLPRLATLPAEVVLGELAVDAGGLSHQEAAARLVQAGPNRLPQARGPSLPRQFAAQLSTSSRCCSGWRRCWPPMTSRSTTRP